VLLDDPQRSRPTNNIDVKPAIVKCCVVHLCNVVPTIVKCCVVHFCNAVHSIKLGSLPVDMDDFDKLSIPTLIGKSRNHT
jgi:methyl coenzyme M reductase subunit C